jgi:hypothetical protein
MYDALCQYANFKRTNDKHGHWDGNVPASYETDDKPPKKLGRWVNRQRSAYANKKLKKEFVEKLEKAGLKWTANDSKKDMDPDEIVRQNIVVQRATIRTAPQVFISGSTVTQPSRNLETGQTVISNATISSIHNKGQPTIVSKAGLPLVSKSTTASRTISTATVTTSKPSQSKVIIPSRSASASKVIIPARSLVENASNISKVVIPARSAISAPKWSSSNCRTARPARC